MIELTANQKAARILTTLQSVVGELGPHSSLKPALRNLLHILAESFDYKRCFISIYDLETNTLSIGLTHTEPSLKQASYSPGQGVIGQIYESGTPVVIGRMKDHPEFLNRAFGRTDAELASLAFIGVPVTSNDAASEPDILGTLCVDLPALPPDELAFHRQFLELVATMTANHVARLQEELAMQAYLQKQGLLAPGAEKEDGFTLPDIVASSKSMRIVLQQIRSAAPSREPVLITGEPGTGKEMLAEVIHSLSPRAEKPLIKINCASLPPDMLMRELFGYEKGAFTGAGTSKSGLLEMAAGGTLLLDEVGECSLAVQDALIAVMDSGEVAPLGTEDAAHAIPIDVRFLASSSRPLEELLEEELLRPELYHRINTVAVYVPALRDRREDIIALAEHFMVNYNAHYAKRIRRLSTPAIDLLVQYHWPGNVRELRTCIERAVLVCEEEAIRSYHLPPSLQTAESSATDTMLSFGEAVAQFEMELLVDALKKAKGNMLQAARDLRVSYRIVNYKVKKYRIDTKRFSTVRRRKKK